MGQSAKSLLALAILLGLGASVLIWAAPRRVDTAIWMFRFVLPVLTIALVFWLIRAEFKKDLVTDHLGRITRSFFERDGLCFAPVVDVVNGVCRFNILFQNRYSQDCVSQVVFSPARKFIGREKVPAVAVEIACPGGAFGVVRVRYPVPPKVQGRTASFEVAAKTKYHNGAGKLLRFKDGLRVGTPGGEFGRAAMTTGLLVVGVISISSPARCKLKMPANVSSAELIDSQPMVEIMDVPQFPTGGFPVQPVGARDA